MNRDSLMQAAGDGARQAVEIAGGGEGVASPGEWGWVWWVAGVALALLLVMVLAGRRCDPERARLREKLRGQSVDFDHVMDNAFHSKELYDRLKTRCHPDRFVGDPLLVEKATRIFASLVKNKYNRQELLKLKKQAEKELNVKF